MKICSQCHEMLAIELFAKRKHFKDGVSSYCKNCGNKYSKASYHRNQEERKRQYRERYAKNPDYFKARSKKYRKENPDVIKNASKSYAERNREMILQKTLDRADKIKLSQKRYRQQNKGKLAAKTMRREAEKLQRTPKWANLNIIRDFYVNCPKGHHVDHVVPLRGKLVSGLHVIENLQYLSASDNVRKSNKFAL